MSDLIDRQPSQKNDSNTLEALDCVSRKAAIDQLHQSYNLLDAEQRLEEFPSEQPETSPEISEILEYLDTVLHPLVSPEHWNVYSELHDMISALPSVQPERKKGKWIDEPIYKQTMDGKTWDGFTYCSECQEMHEYGYRSKFCPNCGADMRGKENETN